MHKLLRLFSLSLWEDSCPEAAAVYVQENQNNFKGGTLVVILHQKATRVTHLSNIVVSALRFGTDTDNGEEFIYVTAEVRLKNLMQKQLS